MADGGAERNHVHVRVVRAEDAAFQPCVDNHHFGFLAEPLCVHPLHGLQDGRLHVRCPARVAAGKFHLRTGQREYQVLLTEEVISLLLAEKYGLLLIMEQAHGTRYESLRESMIDMIAAKTAPMLADEDNCMMLAQIMARNLIDGTVQILKNRVRPREVRTGLNRLVDYHTKGINAMLK